MPILGETKLGEMLSSQPQGLFIGKPFSSNHGVFLRPTDARPGKIESLHRNIRAMICNGDHGRGLHDPSESNWPGIELIGTRRHDVPCKCEPQ